MTERPAPPDLNFDTPPCPLCWQPTESGPEGFECPTCEIYWGQNGSNGEWTDNNAERCDSTLVAFSQQCWLKAGHEGVHRTDYYEWGT